MKQIGIDELKTIQLEILDVVAKFCEERGINYWIDCGTLIGAIRHKGYIPWDDDIDVGMLRPDYDRFMKEFNGTYPRYEFHCIENDPKFDVPFGKVLDTSTVLYEPDEKGIKIAVYVDIFVYDNAPDDDKTANAMFDKRDYYRSQYYKRLVRIFGPARGNLLRRLCTYMYRMIRKVFIAFPSRYYYVRKIIENSRLYISEETKRVGNFTGWVRALCDKKAFSSFIDVDFEGRKYKAPVGYDEWLKSLYGDYMQLPPEEERKTHHAFKAFVIQEQEG